MSKNTILEALYRMGYKGMMTGHGFRGVASTVLHELRSEHGFLHEHIELQLAHVKRDGRERGLRLFGLHGGTHADDAVVGGLLG